MSDGNVPTSPEPAAPDLDLTALERGVTEAHDRLRELERARKNSKVVRYLFTLALLLVFFGWIYVIYASVASFDTDEFADELKGHAERVLPKISSTVEEVFEEVTPAFAKAIDDKLRKAGPVLARRIDDETLALRKNVETGLDKRLRAALSKVAGAQREELQRAFPQLADKPEVLDRMMAAIQDGFQAWVAKQLTTTLNEHVDALLDIKETLASFKADGKPRPVDAEEVLGLWLELVYERMGGDEAVTPVLEQAPAATGHGDEKVGK